MLIALDLYIFVNEHINNRTSDFKKVQRFGQGHRSYIREMLFKAFERSYFVLEADLIKIMDHIKTF